MVYLPTNKLSQFTQLFLYFFVHDWLLECLVCHSCSSQVDFLVRLYLLTSYIISKFKGFLFLPHATRDEKSNAISRNITWPSADCGALGKFTWTPLNPTWPERLRRTDWVIYSAYSAVFTLLMSEIQSMKGLLHTYT